MHDDEMLKKMLMKKKPMLTIQIGVGDDEGEEKEEDEREAKDLAPDGDAKPFAGKESAEEEMAELASIVGDDDEDEKMPNRPMGIGEMAKMGMKKRLKELKKA